VHREALIPRRTKYLKWSESATGLLIFQFNPTLRFLVMLQVVLDMARQTGLALDIIAMLQSAAVESRTVGVVALANDLAATNNNAAMTEVKRRVDGLLETQRKVEILSSRHFDRLMVYKS
jgi:hypothetical protein